MNFLLLTLSTTNEKTLINSNNITFTTTEKINGTKFTRIYLNNIDLPKDDLPCVDVKETAEEIYKKIKK